MNPSDARGPGTAPNFNDWRSRSHVPTIVMMAATAFGIYICYLLAAPFLPSLAWALALAVLFTPFQRWLESRLKHVSVAAVVGVLGAFIVWIPAALFLALEGNWDKALILAVWGMMVIGTIDNLLRPILVANRLKLHTVLAFLSVVGGLILFGPAGLVLGPVALTVTMALLEIMRDRRGRGDSTG